jgi:hypothetical protein
MGKGIVQQPLLPHDDDAVSRWRKTELQGRLNYLSKARASHDQGIRGAKSPPDTNSAIRRASNPPENS